MLDLVAKLKETDEAISVLRSAGVNVPEEATEIQEILHRAVAAEKLVSDSLEIAGGVAAAMHLDRESYEAYATHTGWKSLATGADLPQWDQLAEEIRIAWRVSAAWVIGRTLRHFGVWR